MKFLICEQRLYALLTLVLAVSWTIRMAWVKIADKPNSRGQQQSEKNFTFTSTKQMTLTPLIQTWRIKKDNKTKMLDWIARKKWWMLITDI